MDIKKFLEEIKIFYNRMSKKQKVVLFSSFAGLILILVFVFVIGSRVSYGVLFSNLNDKDASSIINYLDQQKIPYKIVNGNTIEVPKDSVYKLRLDLAAKGLPSGGVVGFEIFDKQNLSMTSFLENVDYTRALEGELTRTIENISSVDSARVNLAIPKPSVFVDKEQPPTASIVLKLNSQISHNQVYAIQKLVAASVPNLTPDNVTIVDTNGNLLSKKENSDETIASSELQYKQLIEKEYAHKIKDLLLPIVGENQIVTTVNVDLDLSKVTQKSIKYDPNSVVRSEQNEEEKNWAQTSAGIPGVISNIGANQPTATPPSTTPTTQQTTTQQGPLASENTKSTINYEISQTETNVVEPLVKIRRVSAAVIVDGNYKYDKKTKKTVYQPLSAVQMADIRKAVEQAIGFDPKRGDTISVVNMQFESTKPKQVSMMSNLNQFYPLLKYILGAILLILFYFLFLRKFIQNVLSYKKGEIAYEQAQAAKAYAQGSVESKIEGKSIKDLEEEISKELDSESALNEEALKDKLIEKKLKEEVERNPEEASAVFKAYISSK
ncbi:MAG: flagellar M-ring protein FliF [Desulfurella sp.]|uniref:flagellar basal-body MS-ring/collar protein FliF n=1 Tax=Desulfurella sp. TaxID=1962857 RepID=UPI000CA70F51|nr:flagellar basal-body MS-ring/collar protein FliF [Desulfurella sp.]PMP90376.1 MAG: flagellar M-ring protein FliF [Desulfurella sp.]HEX12998.1 flagellar M-ring protein FliF [Desulfurella acetivorans]